MSRISLIQDDEKLTYKWGESKIFYRRISTAKRNRIVNKHTKRGKTNWAAVSDEIMSYVIIGWEDVDRGGKQIAFDPDLVAFLPDDITTDILELSGGAIPSEEESLEKNSGISSSGK